MNVLLPFVEIFRYALWPIAPFTWFGLNISTLDVVAAFRLCIALRQIKDLYRSRHVTQHGKSNMEDTSFTRNLATTLIVVYGGEAMFCPLLGLTPSFVTSGVVPGLYAAVQAIVDVLPSIPPPSLETELPLAIIDGITRAYLLCNLIPPVVTTNTSPAIATSPWTLLLSTLVIANGGFFLANLLSFLQPTPLTLTTPPELLPYGWTTTDIWCAPLVTGLYALLTHAQPFWAETRTLIVHLLIGDIEKADWVQPMAPDVARAACAVLLAGMFTARAFKNFGGQSKIKTKTQ